MEAGCQLHLGIVDVGTVFQQLDADTCSKLRRKRLCLQRRAGNLLTSLTDEQRQGILGGTNLTLEVVGTCLHAQIGSLGTLHTGGAHTAELMLQLHHFPCLLRHTAHLLNDLHLLVEHEQRVVAGRPSGSPSYQAASSA